MLHGSVVGRRVPFDHILLINLRSKTLLLCVSISEMWRKTGSLDHKKTRKEVKETIEVLSLNTILFPYRRCSIWPPPISIHIVYTLITSWQTFAKIASISRMIPAATHIHATRSCCVPTGVLYTKVFMCPHKWKSNGVRWGEQEAWLLNLHIQSMFFQRCHSSVETTISCSSWSNRWYAGILSKSSAWQSGDTHNVSKLVVAIFSSFCKWIKWCLLTVFKLSSLLLS